MPNSCQTHTFQGFFSPVQIMNLHSVLIMETEHFIFNAAPRCSIIGDVLLLETVLIIIIRDNTAETRGR